MNLLNIILILPILGVIVTYNGSFFTNKTLHTFSLYLANIIFILSIILWFFLDQSNPGFQFQTQIFMIPAL